MFVDDKETVEFQSRWDFTDACIYAKDSYCFTANHYHIDYDGSIFVNTKHIYSLHSYYLKESSWCDAMTWVRCHYDSISVFDIRISEYNVDHRYLNLRTLCYSTFRTYKKKREKKISHKYRIRFNIIKGRMRSSWMKKIERGKCPILACESSKSVGRSETERTYLCLYDNMTPAVAAHTI